MNLIQETHPELVKRLRALTLKLLPVEVKPESIKEPTSRIITIQVISAYEASAGDFKEAVSSLSLFRFITILITFTLLSYHIAFYELAKNLYGMRIEILLIMMRILAEVCLHFDLQLKS